MSRDQLIEHYKEELMTLERIRMSGNSDEEITAEIIEIKERLYNLGA